MQSLASSSVKVNSPVLCSVTSRIGVVERQGFDQIGVPLEDVTHLTRNGSIARKVRRQKHAVRAKVFGPNGRHGRTHAELPCFIGGSANYRAIAAPRDYHGFAAQLEDYPAAPRMHRMLRYTRFCVLPSDNHPILGLPSSENMVAPADALR